MPYAYKDVSESLLKRLVSGIWNEGLNLPLLCYLNTNSFWAEGAWWCVKLTIPAFYRMPSFNLVYCCKKHTGNFLEGKQVLG